MDKRTFYDSVCMVRCFDGVEGPPSEMIRGSRIAGVSAGHEPIVIVPVRPSGTPASNTCGMQSDFSWGGENVLCDGHAEGSSILDVIPQAIAAVWGSSPPIHIALQLETSAVLRLVSRATAHPLEY